MEIFFLLAMIVLAAFKSPYFFPAIERIVCRWLPLHYKAKERELRE